MKVKELIKALQDYDQELDVRLYCDHGQVPMSLFCHDTGYIEEETYMPEEIHKDDYDKDYHLDAVKVLILGA